MNEFGITRKRAALNACWLTHARHTEPLEFAFELPFKMGERIRNNNNKKTPEKSLLNGLIIMDDDDGGVVV